MESLLVKVNELELELRTKIEKEDARFLENEARAKAFSEKEALLADKESNLKVREAAVSKIESVVQLKEDALALRKDTEALRAKVLDDKLASEKFIAKEKADIANLRAQLNLDTAKYLDDKKLIKEEWHKIKTAKENYREEVLAELKGKLR